MTTLSKDAMNKLQTRKVKMVESKKFRKGLNEGPGAGYTIESKGYDFSNIDYTNAKKYIEVSDIKADSESYTIFVACKDFSVKGKVDEFSAESYYTGTGDVKDLDIILDWVTIKVATYEGIEWLTTDESNELTMDNINLNALLDVIIDALSGCSYKFVYGGGWTHSTYDGTVADDWLDLDSSVYYGSNSEGDLYDIAAGIRLVNDSDIETVDRMVQGYGYETYYEVETETGEYYEEWFDNEDEAIKYAKENGCLSVRALYTLEDWEGNTDVDYGETVWENDDIYESLKESNIENYNKIYNKIKDKLFGDVINIVEDNYNNEEWQKAFALYINKKYTNDVDVSMNFIDGDYEVKDEIMDLTSYGVDKDLYNTNNLLYGYGPGYQIFYLYETNVDDVLYYLDDAFAGFIYRDEFESNINSYMTRNMLAWSNGILENNIKEESLKEDRQPLNREELNALMSKKADEWIADGRITSDTTYNSIKKMFRDEISKDANDVFVDKMFEIIEKRYQGGALGESLKEGAYPHWQYAKWNKERVEKQKDKEIKPLKDITFRDGTEVVFDGGARGYFIKSITGDKRLTASRIARMANESQQKQWTHHGGGNYYTWVNIPTNKFDELKDKLESANVKVSVIMHEGNANSGNRTTGAQRYNKMLHKIFDHKRNLDKAQAEYLRKLGVSEDEIEDLKGKDKLQVKLIDMGEKDNFYSKYDFEKGIMLEAKAINLDTFKSNVKFFEKQVTQLEEKIKRYTDMMNGDAPIEFQDDKQLQKSIHNLFQKKIRELQDKLDFARDYKRKIMDYNHLTDVDLEEDFMMEDTMEKDYNKLFEEMLDLMEFTLVKYEEDEFGLIDQQGGNIGNIEERRYSNATQMLDDLDIYIDDYIIKAIGDELRLKGKIENDDFSYYPAEDLLKYRDLLPDSAWDFDVLDMVTNHSDEVSLNKVEHENGLEKPYSESLKEGWTMIEYESGANPYIAKSDKELNKMISKYGDKIRKINDTYYVINDLEESLKESKGEIVDTLYDVNTLDYEDDKLYKKNIEHYDTYADYDEALETYKKLSHESFYPHVELCQVDVYEDGHRDYKVLKSTYDSSELVEDTIKVKPNSKDIEINIEKEDEDDLGHPIKKGLGDDTKKVIKEDKQSYRQDLIAKYNKDIEDDTKALEVARREREKDSKHATYFDKIIRDLESSIEYAKEQIEKLSSNEPKDKEFDIDALNSNTKRSALRYRNEENRKELERADVIKPSLLKADEQAYKNLVKAAEKATEMSPLGYIYVVKDTYLDFFANWQWTTLVAYTRNSKIGDSYQALNQQEWEMIANAKSDVEIDKALDSMFNDRLNPDQESKRKRDNLEDVMWKLSDLED